MRPKIILLLLQIVGTISATSGACPNGWMAHGTKCYLVVHETYAWIDANEICHVVRGTLVEPRTQEENQFVADLLRSRGLTSAWIGLNDVVEEGVYVWNSDMSREWQPRWESGEPDNAQGAEDCVAIKQNYRWFDDHCRNDIRSVVCQMENEEPVIG